MTDGDKTIGERTKKLHVGTEVYVDVRLRCVVTGFNDIGDAVYGYRARKPQPFRAGRMSVEIIV